jgi:hypothetical protein
MVVRDLLLICAFLAGAGPIVTVLPRIRREWKYGTLRKYFLFAGSPHFTRGYIYDTVAYAAFPLGVVGLSMRSRDVLWVAIALFVVGQIPKFVLALFNPSWLSPPWARDEASYLDEWRSRRRARRHETSLGDE